VLRIRRFRLDRYILSEILGPLALGFLVYTFILLLRFLFDSAEMIIRRGLPVSIVGELLMLTLPNIVVLTLPMSLGVYSNLSSRIHGRNQSIAAARLGELLGRVNQT
jgi:hypothetical protein